MIIHYEVNRYEFMFRAYIKFLVFILLTYITQFKKKNIIPKIQNF